MRRECKRHLTEVSINAFSQAFTYPCSDRIVLDSIESSLVEAVRFLLYTKSVHLNETYLVYLSSSSTTSKERDIDDSSLSTLIGRR